MKQSIFLTVVAAAAATAATEQDSNALIARLPTCSLMCLANTANEFGCDITDFDCGCSKMKAMSAEVAPCLVKAGCNLQEITGVSEIVADICATTNVTFAPSTDPSKSTDEKPSQTSAAKAEDAPGAGSQLQVVGVTAVLALALAVL